MPYYIKDPKRDHTFDNHPYTSNIALQVRFFELSSGALRSYLGLLLGEATARSTVDDRNPASPSLSLSLDIYICIYIYTRYCQYYQNSDSFGISGRAGFLSSAVVLGSMRSVGVGCSKGSGA